MNDTLDSRRLRQTDCYGQRFMRPGTFRYGILPVHGEHVNEARPFAVQVTGEVGPNSKMKQHNVMVKLENGKLVADPREVRIDAGDLVLWNSTRLPAPYVVVGEKEFFGNQRLFNESGYTHAFGAAGEYRWVDAYGSGVSGVVVVRDPGCRNAEELKRWRASMEKAALVTVSDRSAEPGKVEITTGQTVFFAITKGPGISITDERLLAKVPKAGEERRPGDVKTAESPKKRAK
jgi:plastocyanin